MVAVKGVTSLSPYQIMLYRSFPFLLTLPFISWRKSESYNLYDLLYYISYAVLNTSGIILMYVALEFAQLGNVSAICTNLPIPSAILSFLLLREPIRIFDIILFVVNFIGLILVTRPPFLFHGHGDAATGSTNEFLGAVIALGSLLGLAMSTIFSRKLTYRGNSDSALLTFIPGVTGVFIPGTILFITQTWDFPSTFMEGVLTLAVAVLSLFGNFFLALGLNYESVITITVLFTLGVPVSFLVGIFVFKEIPDVLSVVGAFSILVSTFGCLWK
ncbi:Solute carrier family 35 member G1 [Holothuria leucospilota]|uniref:Solute carrier family 35 member G1 n=1 Tax=Holothuria leucospilota TaxID=206669 RepID=A0A9Q1C9G0_HOLLE|nr:Solute carrier family 35 member G1 [Holothuria leucospilota]